MVEYYLDTCIWLNLFKKEKRFWKITKEFIEQASTKEKIIFVSTIVLKELSFKSQSNFKDILIFFKLQKYVKLIKTTPEDYDYARNLETTDKFSLSFYDYLHIALSKRLNCVLVTRDRELIKTATKFIICKKPEELIN